jgi:hypothetical protein
MPQRFRYPQQVKRDHSLAMANAHILCPRDFNRVVEARADRRPQSCSKLESAPRDVGEADE